MIKLNRVLRSSDTNVSKLIFTSPDAIAEAVLYRYGDYLTRTVVCCSVQSGCPVGCTFCGTGKSFVRNLTPEEIVLQVHEAIVVSGVSNTDNISKFQIMFMSMGEPMLNWMWTSDAILSLRDDYPNAQLLVSTIGIDNPTIQDSIVEMSRHVDKIGLQLSLHATTDEQRDRLIPFRGKLNLRQLASFGYEWYNTTHRHPFLNYCVTSENNKVIDVERLLELFDPIYFNITLSVICNYDETNKSIWDKNLDLIKDFRDKLVAVGYNCRIFDPAGQDDIGGGCGQLWFVQSWLKQRRTS